MKELQEMRRQQASSIVIPDAGAAAALGQGGSAAREDPVSLERPGIGCIDRGRHRHRGRRVAPAPPLPKVTSAISRIRLQFAACVETVDAALLAPRS